MYSDALKFMNPSEFSLYLNKYVVKRDKGNPMKANEKKITLIVLLTVENDTIFILCLWQKNVNLELQ